MPREHSACPRRKRGQALLSYRPPTLPTMTTPPTELHPITVPAPGKCCGGEDSNQSGAWIPKRGEPQLKACELCWCSENYWRREEAS